MSVYATDLYDLSIERRINNLAKTNNISDDRIIIDKPSSFINDNGLRRESETLRMPPKYFHPSERNLNRKVFDMMRQALYATQGRIRALEPIMERYKSDPALRMAFIYNRLRQLIVDLRRIYTLALKWRTKKRVFEQVVWYVHCTRKYTDVLYTVQYVIESHTAHVALLKADDAPKMPGMKP